ncbi:MAG: hypothetical protein OHK0029_16650 [Armatimonadaceae bacterium]
MTSDIRDETGFSDDATYFEKERGVSEVEVVHGISHLVLTLSEESLVSNRLTLLKRLADANVPVFLLKLLPRGISFALREAQVEAGTILLNELKETIGFTYEHRSDLALVTIRAGAMRDLSGVMAAIYEILVEGNLLIYQTGDTYNAVYCLLDGSTANQAAERLRRRFALRLSEVAKEPEADDLDANGEAGRIKAL